MRPSHHPGRIETTSSVEAYLRDVKNSEPIGRHEEVELAGQARAGDGHALEQLITSNLRFVISIAREYNRTSGQPMSELISDGNMGLIEAAKRFDEKRGFKFITYAVWWIRQAILKGMAQRRRTLPAPSHRMGDLNTVRRRAEELAQDLGRKPSVQEIAKAAGFSVTRVINAHAVTDRDVYLDEPRFDDEEDETLMSQLSSGLGAPDELAEQHNMADTVDRCLSILDKRERLILRWYYGIDGHQPVTLQEIGHRMGLTRERIRQLRDRGLNDLRTRFGDALDGFSRN